MQPDRQCILTILPPKEGYVRENAGAIALLVAHFLQNNEWVAGRVPHKGDFALKCENTLFSSRFIPVFPEKRVFGTLRNYCAGLKKVIRQLQPTCIEVHNRPEIALSLARTFPDQKMTLFLHNDPQSMRKANYAKSREKLAKCMQIVTVSHWLKQRFTQDMASVFAEQVQVIPNAIDFAALPALLPMNRRKRQIIFAGRVVADKGVDLLAQAWLLARADLPEWNMVVIGADRFSATSPDTPFLAQFRKLAQKSGIQLAGYQTHQAVLQAMAESAIVVVPSRWAEPFGMTALEAMACGAAVMSSGRGGLAEVMGYAAVSIDPEDSAAFAAALVKLARDEGLRTVLSSKGQEQAARFSLEKLAPQRLALRTVFKEVKEKEK